MSSSSLLLLLLELLRDELELEVVGRVRVFVVELERLTLVRERVELERLTRDLSVERLTLVRERVELEFEVVLLYCGRESLLELDEYDLLVELLDEYDRLEEEVEGL